MSNETKLDKIMLAFVLGAFGGMFVTIAALGMMGVFQ